MRIAIETVGRLLRSAEDAMKKCAGSQEVLKLYSGDTNENYSSSLENTHVQLLENHISNCGDALEENCWDLLMCYIV